VFTTICPSVHGPGDLVRGHITFGLFQRLVSVAVKHHAFSFRRQIANVRDFVWYVFHEL
jgi:hypothetical protein